MSWIEAAQLFDHGAPRSPEDYKGTFTVGRRSGLGLNVEESNRGRVQRLPLLRVLVVLVGIFILTTPGALLQPWHFLRDLRQEQEIYAQIGHVG